MREELGAELHLPPPVIPVKTPPAIRGASFNPFLFYHYIYMCRWPPPFLLPLCMIIPPCRPLVSYTPWGGDSWWRVCVSVGCSSKSQSTVDRFFLVHFYRFPPLIPSTLYRPPAAEGVSVRNTNVAPYVDRYRCAGTHSSLHVIN